MKMTTATFVLGISCCLSIAVAKTTRSSKLKEDQIVDLINAEINDRMAERAQCPIDQYWKGVECGDCSEVCGINIDTHCLQMCPAYVLKLIEEEKPVADESFDLSLILSIVACVVAVASFVLIVVCMLHKRISTRNPEKYDSQFTSVESSFMSMTPNPQALNSQAEPLIPPAPTGSPIVVRSMPQMASRPSTPVPVNQDDIRPPAQATPTVASTSRPVSAIVSSGRPVSDNYSTLSSRRGDPLQQVQPVSDTDSLSNLRP